MSDVCNSSYPIRLRRKFVHPASGWLVVLLLWPVGLAGQETEQVTLYTPDGSQQRTLSTPLVIDVGLPSPVEVSSGVTGTGTGTQTMVEVVVIDSTSGQSTKGYANGVIRDLAADTSGNVWVATWTGLSRFDGWQWTTFWRDSQIYSVAVDGQGQVWVGSYQPGDIIRFDGQRWTRYRLGGWVEHIAVAPNGDVWCTGGNEFLLWRFDGQTWWLYDHANVGLDRREEILDIAVDESGTLWVVYYFPGDFKRSDYENPEGYWLTAFDGAEWTSYQLPAGHIFADSQGRVWLSSGRTYVGVGLYVKEGSTWKHYPEVGTGDDVRWRVRQMTEDAAGRLWIVEENYFGVLEGTTWTGFYSEEFSVNPVPYHASYVLTRASVIDSRGDLWISSFDGMYRWHQSDLPTAIESSAISAEPRSFHLEQNYPNPFNHATHIGFTLKQSSSVSLQVFNTHGQLVATLVEGTRSAGTYQTVWDGRDDQGQAVSSGIYIVRLDAAGQQASRKMLLVQ